MNRLRSIARSVRSSPTGIAGLILFAIFLVIAIIGPPLWTDDGSKIDSARPFEAPFGAALLGTDGLGRDVLARTLAATRLSLELTFLSVLIAVLIGVPFGAAAGVVGPRMRKVTSSAITYALALPPLLLSLFLVTVIGPGALGATVAIGVALVPMFARTAQTLASSIGESEYIAAARVLGVPRRTLMVRHILPNAAEPLVLLVGVGATLSLILISALSFLGLGVQSPDYDWGKVLSDGLQALYTTPAAAITPGVMIVIAGVMLTFLGEALARNLNPELRYAPPKRARRRAKRSRRKAGPEASPTSANSPAGELAPERAGATIAVDNLVVAVPRGDELQTAVAGVSLALQPGEIVGVVGESGAGKSLMALSLAGLAPSVAEVSADRLEFQGFDLLEKPNRARRRALATSLSVVFQDPMSSLNPALRVGRQLTEKVEIHAGMSRRDALALAEERLTETSLPAARERLRQYPHEFSGGMRQRVMIAMGLMSDPALILADEPTTALDVTVQAQILDLLRDINARTGTAVLFISHDLAVISELCERVIVMYAGRVVETLSVEQLESPAHPYTRALLGTNVDLDSDREAPLTAIPGQPPALGSVTLGCPFADRCPEVYDRCRAELPALEPVGTSGHVVACWARATQPAEKECV